MVVDKGEREKRREEPTSACWLPLSNRKAAYPLCLQSRPHASPKQEVGFMYTAASYTLPTRTPPTPICMVQQNIVCHNMKSLRGLLNPFSSPH